MSLQASRPCFKDCCPRYQRHFHPYRRFAEQHEPDDCMVKRLSVQAQIHTDAYEQVARTLTREIPQYEYAAHGRMPLYAEEPIQFLVGNQVGLCLSDALDGDSPLADAEQPVQQTAGIDVSCRIKVRVTLWNEYRRC
jgi:hypothetical protein